jgi:hypothetical protein
VEEGGGKGGEERDAMEDHHSEIELVMSTRIAKHVEMDQNLAHGCMMA